MTSTTQHPALRPGPARPAPARRRPPPDPYVYAARLGRRLRAARERTGLTLGAVQDRTAGEFKASVLGAYERGERAISVVRLARLAAVYGVPVTRLLP